MPLYITSEAIRRVDTGGGTYGWRHEPIAEHRRKADAIAFAEAHPYRARVWRYSDNASIHCNGKDPRTVDYMDRRHWCAIA